MSQTNQRNVSCSGAPYSQRVKLTFQGEEFGIIACVYVCVPSAEFTVLNAPLLCGLQAEN